MSQSLAPPGADGDWVNFVVISQVPLIAVTNCDQKIFRAILHAEALSEGRPAHLFARISFEVDNQAQHLRDVPAFVAARAPHVRLKILATNEKSVTVLTALGLSCVLCSPTAFVDEFVMYPTVPQNKTWDAVYTARFMAFKRHELAAEIKSIAFIGSPWGTSTAEAHQIRAAYPHAAYPNFSADGTYRKLDLSEVCAVVNRARVGIILSETEGANKATAEYLLCGVPVVTTPPQGGRELFLPPSVCEIADPDPRSVAAAVDRLIARRLDPFVVRQTAMQLIQPHRDVFMREVRAAVAASGATGPVKLLSKLPYGLLKYRRVPQYPI